MSQDLDVVGKPTPRIDAVERVTGRAKYTWDIQLPGMDGVAALRELRKLPATVAVPVIAVTAFAMKDDRERLLAAGFDGYVEKPIDVRALPAYVRSYLASTSAGAEP